jgi:hypothetical protein
LPLPGREVQGGGLWSGGWSTHNHYHADGNGNVTYLVNSSQGLAASYRYDPYGRLMGSSGTLAAANLHQFVGNDPVGFYDEDGLILRAIQAWRCQRKMEKWYQECIKVIPPCTRGI